VRNEASPKYCPFCAAITVSRASSGRSSYSCDTCRQKWRLSRLRADAAGAEHFDDSSSAGDCAPAAYEWTVGRDGRYIGCAVHDDGLKVGVEVQISRDGAPYVTRQYASLAEAARHADHIRRNLQRDGWTVLADD
jgi:hypothetical protein